MRVDHDAFVFVKGIAENNVRCFSSYTGQGVQFCHRVRHFPAMFLDDRDRRAANASRLCSERNRSNESSIPVRPASDLRVIRRAAIAFE